MYKVIKSHYLARLEEEVNLHMSQGWTPQGGVSASEGHYHQAMIKRNDEAKVVEMYPKVTFGQLQNKVAAPPVKNVPAPSMN